MGGLLTGGTSTNRGGVFRKLVPPIPSDGWAPNTVGQNTFNDANLYAFDEGQNITLGENGLKVDQDSSGKPGSLPAGTVVSSHLVFFDPATGTASGYVDFDADIVGILETAQRQQETDPLIHPQVHYLTPKKRGLEKKEDSVVIEPANSRRLLVSFAAGSPGDYVRVLTGPSRPYPLRTIVPASSDPWLAGYPVATTNITGSVSPAQSPPEVYGVVVRTGSFLTFATDGEVQLPTSEGSKRVGPNGDLAQSRARAREGARSISGSTAPIGALMGVFLGHNAPHAGATPKDFSYLPLGRVHLAPLLKQVFYIGSGRTPDGAQKRVSIPTGATRLFLGIMAPTNAAQYTGQFTVDLQIHPNPRITVPKITPAQVELCWEPASGAIVQLESTDDPIAGPWTAVGAALPGDTQPPCLSVTPSADLRKFYRLAIRY